MSKELAQGHRLYPVRQVVIDPDLLPDSPGIYMWRYQPSFDGKDLKRLFSKIHKDIANIDQFRNSEGIVDNRYKVKISRYSFPQNDTLFGLGTKDLAILETLFGLEESMNSQAIKEVVAQILRNIPPLYLGKAMNLNKRLKKDIDSIGGVFDLLKKLDLYSIYQDVKIEYIAIQEDDAITKIDKPQKVQDILAKILLDVSQPIFP